MTAISASRCQLTLRTVRSTCPNGAYTISTLSIWLRFSAIRRQRRPPRCTPSTQAGTQAVGLASVSPGCPVPFLLTGRAQVGKGLQRSRPILHQSMAGAAHRQIDVGMGGQILGLFQVDAATGQVGDERMPECVEIGDPSGFVPIRPETAPLTPFPFLLVGSRLFPGLRPLRYLHSRWDSYPAGTPLPGQDFHLLEQRTFRGTRGPATIPPFPQ